MLARTVNHVGMVVPNIQDFLEKNAVLYSSFSRSPLIQNPIQQVQEMFISDGRTVIELLEPTCPTSPLNAFLKRNRSGGLVHIAIDVDDLNKALEEIEAADGKVIVAPTPDIAFPNRRIAFVVLNGQVTELIEQPLCPGEANANA